MYYINILHNVLHKYTAYSELIGISVELIPHVSYFLINLCTTLDAHNLIPEYQIPSNYCLNWLAVELPCGGELVGHGIMKCDSRKRN